MKVPGSVRDLHQQCLEARTPLRLAVDQLITSKRSPKWHYESRLKEPVSFALKLESGRVQNPEELEDFFACTIVVETWSAIQGARDFVAENFAVAYERPKDRGITYHGPSDFPFDDLRIYARWLASDDRPKPAYSNIVFEIQVKTYLQHAWGIATHDLMYKGGRANWALHRVAYQIRAMLEHAETSILGAEEISKTEALSRSNKDYRDLQATIDFLERNWDNDALPKDRVGLAKNVNALLRCLDTSVKLLEQQLVLETQRGRGTKTLNLSPYGVIIETLLRQNPALFASLKSPGNEKFRLFLPREIESRDSLADVPAARLVSL